MPLIYYFLFALTGTLVVNGNNKHDYDYDAQINVGEDLVRTRQSRTNMLLDASIQGDDNFWKDSYRIDFSYDPTSANGPNHWGDLEHTADDNDNDKDASSSWGEWSTLEEDGVRNPNGGLNFKFESNECNLGEDNNNNKNNKNKNNKNYYSKIDNENRMASPIALEVSGDCQDEHEILMKKINPNSDCLRSDLSMEITPSGLKAYYPLDDDRCTRPAISPDGFDDNNIEFVLAWMELHTRAEHVIDNKRYDAELQMVHVGRKISAFGNDRYRDIEPNLMLIVSVWIEAGATKDHAEIQYLLDGWQRQSNQEKTNCFTNRKLQANNKQQKPIKKNNLRWKQREALYHQTIPRQNRSPSEQKKTQPKAKTKAEQEINNSNCTYDGHIHGQVQRELQRFNCQPDKFGLGCEDSSGIGPRIKKFPYSIWPGIHYFAYKGTITTPPCSGNVYWYVMDIPIRITKRQYKQMVALSTQSINDETCEMDSILEQSNERNMQHIENYRPIQTPDDKSDPNVAHCSWDDFQYRVYSKNFQ